MCDFVIKVVEWLFGILASVIVVFITQKINDSYFKPRNDLKVLLRDISSTIDYYRNIISSPGSVKREREDEASDAIRKAAMELKSFCSQNPKIKYKELDSKGMTILWQDLLGISNAIGNADFSQESLSKLSEIYQLLRNTFRL